MQTEELQIKIGKKLKELRTINQWTQEQVAGQLHLTRNAYSDIELGKTDICISRLAQLANFFGVDIGYFVDDKEKVVFYLTGNHNTQATNKIGKQCNEYHGSFTGEKLQHELEKQQLVVELKDKELAMKDRENDNLREIIALLKREPLPPQPI